MSDIFETPEVETPKKQKNDSGRSPPNRLFI